jgi:oxygen-independent coproporphyrinogen-3 oxidase
MAGIYIHIPFCKQACHYCDFHFSTSLGKKNEMITAIQKELVLRKSELATTTIETIYFGGGTPSMLSFEEIEAILETIYKNYTITENPEITLEANPDDLTETKIKEFSNSKINRLSIGIQSFFDAHLHFMNRAHAGDEAKKCLELATQYFDNITIDLMYGIPKMTMQEWKENLEIAFSFDVNHISSYVLTVEPKTALEKFIRQGTCPDVSGSESWAHFSMLVEETEKQGYIQYEVSSFGKSGYFSKHNSSYWKGATYIGIGPGAHSYDKTSRSWNVSNNPLYIKSIAKDIVPITKEILSLDDQYNEYVMTGVRTIWGISLAYIQEEFGEAYVQHTLKVAALHLQEKNIQLKDNIIRTTQKGQFLCDGISTDFFRV